MSLVHLDFPSGSPGLYGTTAANLTNGVYAFAGTAFSAVVLTEDPDPNVSGNVLRMVNGAGYDPYIRYVLPAAATKVGIARRIWLSDLPVSSAYNDYLFEWRNLANSNIAYVRIDTTGRITITCGALTATSTNPAISANAWQHIEGIYDADTNQINVYVEGVLKVSLSDATITATVYQVVPGRVPDQGGASYRHYQYLKDLVIWDGAGTDNNTQMGSLQVFDLVPVTDVSVGGWLSTGADIYGVLDNSPPVDASYVSSAVPPTDPCIMTLSDLPDDIVAIRGMAVWTRAWKNDGGDAKLQPGLSPDETNWDDGDEHVLSTAATYYRSISERSPAGGGVWTPGEVNDLRLRLNRTV